MTCQGESRAHFSKTIQFNAEGERDRRRELALQSNDPPSARVLR